MNDIVKYENRLNTLPLSNFSAVELNLFMTLCSKVKDRGQDLIELDYTDLKKKLGLQKETDKYLHDELYKMSDKLSKINCNFKNEREFITFNLFSTFNGNLDTRKLKVRVNIDYQFLLNELAKNFTRFELIEFVKLDSKYSKNLYRILKQYRTTGTYRVECEKFRELMDCPKSYSNVYFMRDCVNKAVSELSQGYFDNLKVTPIRAPKQGRPVIAYEFTFKPSKEIPGQMNLPTDEGATDPTSQPKPKKATKKATGTKFDNFHQRDNDYASLEAQLLK